MNWKGRQMFGGRPSGIVQMMGGGMTPYPTHVMPDGTVMPGATHGEYEQMSGGYEAGGPVAPAEPSIEERVAMIAAQQGISVPKARAQLLQKTAADQGMQLPPEAVQQFAVGMINLQDALAQGVPAMQAGGLLIGKDQFVDPSPDGQEMLTEETRVLKGLYNDIIKAMEQTSMDFGTIIDSRVTQGSVTRKAAEDLKKVYAIQKMRQTQKMQDLPFSPGMAPKPEDFFPSGPPTNMQAGGMVGAELFEEGDSDINNALNTMASVSNPEVPDMPASNGMSILGGEMGSEEMMMDQGLEEMEVLELKAKYQEVALATVEAANKAIQEGAPPEQLKEPIKERLTAIDKQYRQKTGAEDTILTPEFMAKLQGLTSVIPAMQDGGEVSSLYVNTELDDARYVYGNALKRRVELEDKLAEETNPRNKRRILQQLKKAKEIEVLTGAEYERLGGSQASTDGTGSDGTGSDGTGSGGTGSGGTSTDGTGSDGTGSGGTSTDGISTDGTGSDENDSSEKILEELKALSTVSSDSSELQKKKQELARRAAYLGGKTKQSGLSGLFDVMGQADAAEVEAVSNMPQQLSSNETALERMRMDIEAQRNIPFASTKEERDLDNNSVLLLSKIFADLIKEEGSIAEAQEAFAQRGYKIPENLKGIIQGTITIVTPDGKAKEGVGFNEFYRRIKDSTIKDKDGQVRVRTFEEISEEFRKRVAAGVPVQSSS